MEAGGHFAALEEPQVFADELRSFSTIWHKRFQYPISYIN